MTPALIVGWMTQAIVVSALLALAALLLQKLAGRALPNRMIWSGALFSSLVLVLVRASQRLMNIVLRYVM